MSVISFQGVSKNYGKTKALINIDLELEPNQIYGLLGRNGAGKTTLLNLLTNRIYPSAGTIQVDGAKVKENDDVLSQMAYMTEINLFPDTMRVRQVLHWAGEFYPSFDRVYAVSLCEKFKLNPKLKVQALSTGYSSILKAIVTLASQAPILIFDEPVLGLDANHRELFYRELITNYNANPKTIIISTHLIEEIAKIIEAVIIIDDGQMILKESAENIRARTHLLSGDGDKLNQFLIGKSWLNLESIGEFETVIILEPINREEHNLAKELDIDISKVDLQKLFIALTNSKEGEANG